MEGQVIPDANDEYLLYQTLVGVWPVETMNAPAREVFRKRMKDYMLKALREGKVNSSWINPNNVYEDATLKFIDAILNNVRGNNFFDAFQTFLIILEEIVGELYDEDDDGMVKKIWSQRVGTRRH